MKTIFLVHLFKGRLFVETRVEKYKNYRQSLQRDETSTFETEKKPETHTQSDIFTSTTSSLPLDQVMGTFNERNDEELTFIKKRRKEKIIKYSIFGAIGVIVITILIILLVLALEGKK